MDLLERFEGRWRRGRERLRLLLGGGLPLGDLPRALAGAFGERPALEGAAGPGLGGGTRSFAGLEDDVARLAAAHASAGLGDGVVAIVCHNRIDLLLHVLALSRAGAVPLPLNHRLRPEEQAAAIAAAGAEGLVADADAGAPLALSAAGRGLRVTWTGAGGPAPRAGTDLPAWLAANGRARLARGPDAAAERTALLLCTSGTTGKPKLARLTGEGLLGAIGRLGALPVGHQRGLRAGRDVVLEALPLVHVMGLATALGTLCAGVKLVHLERFDAAEVLARIERERPNVFVGVPTMYADLESAGAAARDLSSVQLWVSAADVLPPDRARRFQRYGSLEQLRGKPIGCAALADVYGMVELAGPAALRLYPPGPRAKELPAVGFVLPGFTARVVGEGGRALGWGKPGELQLRGGAGFAGYQGAGAPAAGAWFATGDVARLGPGGSFALVGRSAERIKVGGFSVFPAEVEEALGAFPGAAEVVLTAVADERLGDRPVALVVPAGGAFDAGAFLAWAEERVAPYRRPRQAAAVEALPRGPNGKLDRRAARALAERLFAADPPKS